MAVSYSQLLFKIADLERKQASMLRVGTVSNVQQDKLRVKFGRDKDGKEVEGPWIHPSRHDGVSRSRMAYDDGQGDGGGGGGGGQGGGQQQGGTQNFCVICPGGDIRQAFGVPYSPNKNHPPPSHAQQQGKANHEETWEMDKNAYSRGKDGYDWWLNKEKQKGQFPPSGGGGGQGGQGGGGNERNVGGEKAAMKSRYNEKGGITHRVGTDAHLHSDEKGSILQMTEENWVETDKKRVKVNTKLPPQVKMPWVVATPKRETKKDTA